MISDDRRILARYFQGEKIMGNTVGQSKANKTSESENDNEKNPAGKCSGAAVEEGNSAWRPTDSPVEISTDEAFDDEEAKKRNKNIHSETPGLHPDIAE